ncbi:MAG: ABC transporter permease [Planctomycetota bacterium]
MLAYVGGVWLMFADALYYAFIGPYRGRRIRHEAVFIQMVRVGVRSIPITSLVLFFVGMIIAIQMAYVLRLFGMKEYVAAVVGVSIIRELGPLLTAVVLTGYAGAAIAAELGTMKVSEEILAYETAALSPVRFLVVPRLLGMMVMTPCLTVLADVVGIGGGFVVATKLLGISPEIFIAKTLEYIVYKDVYTGLVKAEVFAIIIAMVACFEGFRVEGGAEGVGKATTASVVLSIVLVIVADLFFTVLFYFVWQE